MDDAHSWTPGAFPGFGAATMYDDNDQPKPAFNAVATALGGSTSGGGGGPVHAVGADKCLDVPNSSTTPGVQLQIWDCSGNAISRSRIRRRVSCRCSVVVVSCVWMRVVRARLLARR